MLTEDLYPRWELLPTDWRSDISAALVEATEWMVKGQKMLAKEIKKRKAKQLIGAAVLTLVNYSDIEHHRKGTYYWKPEMNDSISDLTLVLKSICDCSRLQSKTSE